MTFLNEVMWKVEKHSASTSREMSFLRRERAISGGFSVSSPTSFYCWICFLPEGEMTFLNEVMWKVEKHSATTSREMSFLRGGNVQSTVDFP